MLQREIVEGDLLKDCLEVGTDDLKGLVQILKDIASQYAASSSGRAELWSSEGLYNLNDNSRKG